MKYDIMKTVAFSGIILLLLDAIYLYAIKKMFETQITSIQREPMRVRAFGAVVCYILLIGGLYHFILKTHRPIWDAFFFGIVIYGVYESTNYALFKQWKWEIMFMDTLWGGILMALTTFAVYFVL